MLQIWVIRLIFNVSLQCPDQVAVIYAIIVAAVASDPAPVQLLASYSAYAIGDCCAGKWNMCTCQLMMIVSKHPLLYRQNITYQILAPWFAPPGVHRPLLPTVSVAPH